ncbi:adenosylmethionine--8-amino-7-oxononanoate transaminase [Flavitalea sp.]|nr:adenosylmethionine--8-amino-7-oxononanoate transaminase [Flavitalea sp.]
MENSLSERDKQVIWHPYTPQKYAATPISIAKGEGAYLIGTDGSRYLDCISSWWVTLHGHGHPYIAEKIYRQALQLEQVIFAGFTHEPAVKLAERLIPLLPGSFSKIFYSDNGSTSVEVAIKMAVQFWWNNSVFNRTKIFAFRDAYHGDTFGAMSVSGKSIFNAAFEAYMFEVIYLDVPRENNLEKNKELIDEFGAETACFIYEPLLQGAGGMNMYEAAPMDLLLNYIRSKEIICISDEVLTGFGRTGSMFAGEKIQNKADIICLSKGLTGGTMALGVTACTAEIHEAYLTDDRSKTFFHGHSFTANPIACSAALASLDLLTEISCQDQIKMIHRKHLEFGKKISGAGLHEGLVQNFRVLGTIVAFELNSTEKNYLNQSAAGLTSAALEHFIFIRPLGNTIYLMPPFCITSNELDTVYDTLIGLLQKNAR